MIDDLRPFAVLTAAAFASGALASRGRKAPAALAGTLAIVLALGGAMTHRDIYAAAGLR